MAYRIEFYYTNVQADVLTWPAEIAANFAAVVKRVILHHGFIKKTPKTPVADLRIARKRLQEIHHG